jgi:DNA-binding MarR family transcriptional regulator
VASDNRKGKNVPPLTDLDRVIHEPARLAILVHLYVADRADFLYLMRQTGLTGGNLSSHIAKLETSGYVKVDKSFEGKIPRTTVQLTGPGRSAFENYRQAIVQALAGSGGAGKG